MANSIDNEDFWNLEKENGQAYLHLYEPVLKKQVQIKFLNNPIAKVDVSKLEEDVLDGITYWKAPVISQAYQSAQ